MTIVPLAFPQPSEAAVASYDWTAIASATGYTQYYLALVLTGVEADAFILTENQVYSHDIVLSLIHI